MPGFFTELARLEAEGAPFILATVIEAGGSTPREVGAQMAVTAEALWGTVGGGAIELRCVEIARALLSDPLRETETLDVHLNHDLGMSCGGRMKVFMQKITAAPRLWIFGAGHCGTALAHLAPRVGWAVTVIDHRPEWADPARFPEGVHVIAAHPVERLSEARPAPHDYAVIVNYSHALDGEVLAALLSAPPRYIGQMASRRKWIKLREGLLAQGFSEAVVDQVRAPVGLPIQAFTPEEIAVSILAQMVAERRAAP
ncbi:XdhC/CoxI family protein [Myxococcota bacterium]|nr:XdhC/CoxI family protein [Myxococcota bacterium]MBU1428942.1 XdhC/CoxI family protein [Myxococcota bacterium]MBU1898240.1 XdhC/CoxI family protein [Myxococcota bacterium]